MTVKELRERTGLSQGQFAARFQIPVRTLQDWEQGRRTPPDYVVAMIEQNLDAKEGNGMAIIDVANCKHNYDPDGCCRICGHLKPGGLAWEECQENQRRLETMDKLQAMFRNAEAEFSCNLKNGGVCCHNGFCDLHKQHEIARYLVNHGVQIKEE